MFLQRWVKRHAMPIILKSLKREEVVKYYPDNLEDYDQQTVDTQIYNQANQIDQSGGFLDPQQVMLERQRGVQQLQASGKERFVKVLNAIDIMDYDVAVQITNENFDKGVLTSNLITALQAAPEYKKPLLESLFDLMGIGPFKALPAAPIATPPTGAPTQNPLETLTMANTGMGAGTAQAYG